MFLTCSFSHFKVLLFFFFFLFLPFVLFSSELAQHSTQLSPSSSLSSQRWTQASSPAKDREFSSPFSLHSGLADTKLRVCSYQTYRFHHGCKCLRCRPHPIPLEIPSRCPPCWRNSRNRCHCSAEINLGGSKQLQSSRVAVAYSLVMPLTRKSSLKRKGSF